MGGKTDFTRTNGRTCSRASRARACSSQRPTATSRTASVRRALLRSNSPRIARATANSYASFRNTWHRLRPGRVTERGRGGDDERSRRSGGSARRQGPGRT